MRKAVFYSFWILAFIYAFINTSCTSNHKREDVMLDSLELNLLATANNMEIDASTIEARKEQIDRNYNLVKTYYLDTMSVEIGNNMQKYRGILKIYKMFLSENENIIAEQKALSKQVKLLRKDIHNGKITKQAFRQFYDKEKEDINVVLAMSQKVGKTVKEVEPEYQRLHSFVEGLLGMLAVKNPELKGILDSNK